MKRRCAWLLVSLLALASNAAQAGLRLILDETDLRPTERSASTALLDEAASALPPRLVASLDRQVQVRWLDGLPSATYGRAGPDVLELNRRLLPSLADGTSMIAPASGLPTRRWSRPAAASRSQASAWSGCVTAAGARPHAALP